MKFIICEKKSSETCSNVRNFKFKAIQGRRFPLVTYRQVISNFNANFCSDFRYESNGIFVLGVGFFLQTNFDYLTSQFKRDFSNHSKGIVILSLNLQKYFTCNYFLLSYGGLKVALLAYLGQLTRNIFRAINA